jgi:DNA-binding transcriptional ArsR family regulator
MSQESKIEEAMFTALSNPLRRKILEFIDELGGATYTDLTETFGLKSGPLYYHLRQMKQFVYQDDHKKYRLTEDGLKALNIFRGKKEPEYEVFEEPEKPKVFSIWKFSLVPLIRFFAKNPIHALIEFLILAGASVFIGWGNDFLIVGNFVILYDVPLWLGYVSLFASWIFIGGSTEILSRFVFKKRRKPFALMNVTNLIFLPSFLFTIIVGIIAWSSGTTVIIPSVVLLILHGVFQIWSFLIIITAVGDLKEISIEKSAIVAMLVSYTQIFTLIFILL